MKIGILTLHDVMNFGASLQSYALRRVLQKKYGDATVIDYRSSAFYTKKRKIPPFDKEFRSALLSGHIRSALHYEKRVLEQRKNASELRKGFSSFMRYLVLTKTVETAEAINDLCIDRLILGSDQIWTPVKTFDPIFWGVGLTGNVSSYAASGITEMPADDKLSLIKNNFQHISVREKTAQNILETANISAELVLDPILLADKAEFDEIKISPRFDTEYLFCYNLGNDPNTHQAAEHYAETMVLNLIEITGTHVQYFVNGKKYYCASPQDFVGLISGAKAVVTNSFHGTVLSLIYHKPFVSILFKNTTRIPDLLDQFQIDGRIYSDSHVPDIKKEIDWAEFEKQLTDKKASSHRFLKQVMQGDECPDA